MLNIFLGVLTALLAALKIAGHITLSWWLILLPIYGPVVLGLIGLGIIAYVNK